PLIVDALNRLLPLRAVVARNDSGARRQEGLAETVTLLSGSDAGVEVVEGGVRFPIDPLSGQKTGWYFDQRRHRDRVAALAAGARLRPDGTPGGAGGGARRIPVRRLLQPSCAAGGLGRTDSLRPLSCATRRPHPVHRRRRPRPSGTPSPAGECLSEDAADPGAV